MQNVSTLIFDLDGTISDPSMGIHRCMNHALHFYGFPEVSTQTVLATIGPPLDETFSKLQPSADQKTIAELVVKYRERYAQLGFAENTIYPGIEETLHTFQKRGVRMGVCTSKRADFAEKILSMFGLLRYFSFVDGGDVGIKKRAQLASLLAAGQIDQSSVMIGDREVDISSAKANGLGSVGVLWGFGDRGELEAAGADIILSNTSELCQIEISDNGSQ